MMKESKRDGVVLASRFDRDGNEHVFLHDGRQWHYLGVKDKSGKKVKALYRMSLVQWLWNGKPDARCRSVRSVGKPVACPQAGGGVKLYMLYTLGGRTSTRCTCRVLTTLEVDKNMLCRLLEINHVWFEHNAPLAWLLAVPCKDDWCTCRKPKRPPEEIVKV